MPEPNTNDPIWERRIRWLLLIIVVAAVGLPVLWMKDVLSLPMAVAIGALLWLGILIWGGFRLAETWEVSFWDALVRMWRTGRGWPP